MGRNRRDPFGIINDRELTSGSFCWRRDVLRFVESRQTVVRDFEHPAGVDDTVARSEITVDTYRAGVDILHSLQHSITLARRNH